MLSYPFMEGRPVKNLKPRLKNERGGALMPLKVLQMFLYIKLNLSLLPSAAVTPCSL